LFPRKVISLHNPTSMRRALTSKTLTADKTSEQCQLKYSIKKGEILTPPSVFFNERNFVNFLLFSVYADDRLPQVLPVP
jgi:hypothetical protein